MEKAHKRKICLSGTNGITARYGGWDQLLIHIAIECSNQFDVISHGSQKDHDPSLPTYGCLIKLFNLPANGIMSVIFDLLCMIHARKNNALCIMLGTSGGIFFPFFRLVGLSIILNPDGQEWKRSKWGFIARYFLLISDFIAINSANVVISDHPEIQKRAKSRSFIKNLYIPYGGNNDLANGEKLERSSIVIPGLSAIDYFFTVCRIEPENNIHLILEAAAIIKATIVVVGNWNNSDYGKKLRDKYAQNPEMYLLDPIYNIDRLNQLRQHCKAYIHGHTVGGTNPSLLEAMWLGLDIIAHDNKFNKYVTRDSASYFYTTNELACIMTSKLNSNLPSDVGAKMNKIVEQYYKWTDVQKAYSGVINDCIY